MKHLICAFLIILLICSNSFAKEKQENPVPFFLAVTIMSRDICKLTAESNTYSAISESISKGIEEPKKYYVESTKFLIKNKKATSMIKDYYAYWITSMRAIMPENQELELLYKQRIANDDRKLEEMRNRIRLELNL